MPTAYAYKDAQGNVVTTTLPPDDPGVAGMVYLPMIAPASSDQPVLLEVGMCISCRRWRTYGEPCAVCGGTNLDFRQVIDQELKAEFAQLVLATQDLLFEYDADVKDAVNPLRWVNATNGWLRNRITVLRGLAATNGIPLPTASQVAEARATVVKNIDGEAWECLEGPAGLTPLRKVQTTGADFKCQWCDKEFAVRIGWYRHEGACKRRPADAEMKR